MVAMGTSFSDRAWGRETAVYRVTGVLTVVSGWFMTAVIAISVAFVFANIIHYTNGIGVIFLLAFCIFVIIKTHKAHGKRSKEAEEAKVYNLKKIKDASASRAFTFEHMGHLLKEIRESLDITFDALFEEDVVTLRVQKKKVKQIQQWVNIITANIFKVLRLQQQEQDVLTSYKYAQTIRRLQKLSDGHRDIVLRSYVHVSNHHKGLLPVQISELKKVKESLLNILSEVEETFNQRQNFTPEIITKQLLEIKSHADLFHFKQIERIQDETSKTRLSILFYAIVGNCMMLGKQNLKLLEIFEESFPVNDKQE
jgi:Ca2+/Na+ antiporter